MHPSDRWDLPEVDTELDTLHSDYRAIVDQHRDRNARSAAAHEPDESRHAEPGEVPAAAIDNSPNGEEEPPLSATTHTQRRRQHTRTERLETAEFRLNRQRLLEHIEQ